MRFDLYSFPHPILGRADDVSGEADATLEIGNDGPDGTFEIAIVHSIHNQDIEKLIRQGDAIFFTEISCSSTLFRTSFTSVDARQTVYVKKDSLRGKVEILFLVIATSEIHGYLNSEAHSEFAGLTSDLDKGDILAFSGRSTFIADVEFRKMKASASFMEIGESQKETGEFEIELDHPKIQIKLSKEDYRKYTNPNIGRNPQYASLFQSSVALPSLIYALHQISPTSEKEDYRDKLWAQVLQTRIKNELEPSGIHFDDDSTIHIAQKLLGLPLERLLKDTEISLGGNGDEEDEI